MEIKNLKKIWLISIFVLLLSFSMYLVYINKEDNKTNNNVTNKNKYEIVENYNDFYTVNSCITRYMIYLYEKDSSSILKVLDEKFITNNGINENNVFNYLNFSKSNTFKSLKMYEEKVNKNVVKYYVYGYAVQEIMDEMPIYEDAYFIVFLDKNEGVFSIYPYDGEIFK